MKLYKSDKVRFIIGLIIIFILYSCYYIFIAEHKNTALIPRKLRHVITLVFTLAVYFVGTFHLGKLKVTWMASLWHIVHVSGLCIITAIGLFDWLFLEGKTILSLSRLARTIQELLISPILYVAMGLLNRSLNNKNL
ncbi:hypothetical protein [Winogradskyella sp. UBA3174]|uniref:hypothetical protein n=1 Tax=Winogradskyella sp. UBA3174 TaxID=1947785 RepID=UPI0025D45AE9|nr:hypothetical protein [Winogradskyella sp. UBA3174]|tara:strand:+ start:2312 stop:2722 length:411 start_codon:yes stop_codon:yes gene_type:complete